MIDNLLAPLTLLTALGCAIVGGTFYGFSSFIMKSFRALPASQGIAAMRSINVVVLGPWFMVPFIGTALASLVLMVTAILRRGEPGAPFLLLGGLLYFVGCFVVTIACNVPRNNALMGVEANSAAGATLWASYVPAWTAWNTVRTVAALAALLALLGAFGREGAG